MPYSWMDDFNIDEAIPVGGSDLDSSIGCPNYGEIIEENKDEEE